MNISMEIYEIIDKCLIFISRVTGLLVLQKHKKEQKEKEQS